MVEINKSVRGPDFLLQFFAGDDLPRTLQEHLENLEWLLLEFDLDALFAQFAGPEVQLKCREANCPTWCVEIRHAGKLPELWPILAPAVRLGPSFRQTRRYSGAKQERPAVFTRLLAFEIRQSERGDSEPGANPTIIPSGRGL